MSHHRTFVRAAVALAVAAACSAPALAQSTFAAPPARAFHAAPGQSLASLANGSRAAAVASSLRARGADDATAQSLVELRAAPSKFGTTHVRLQQQVGGLAIYGSDVKATFGKGGELVSVVARVAQVPAAPPRAATIGERQALDAAMARVHPGANASFTPGASTGATMRFDGGPYFASDPEVTRVLVPQADGSLAQGFLVETWTQADNRLDVTLVGGDGTVLAVEHRTASDRYNVFKVDPAKTPQAIVNGPLSGPQAPSQLGWLSGGSQTTVNINGNNASAYLDTDNNNRPDRGGTAVATGDFLTGAALTQSPSITGNREVAVQNLFYLNNVIHDILYTHGFVEGAGNFQASNFGNGGQEGDPVNAEAQDGGGTDNANFATPTDGKRPRMQMYLWTGTGPTHEVVVGGTSYGAKGAEFGATLTTTGVTGVIAPSVPADGCTAIGATVKGRLALIDRGACTFVAKVQNAQSAGAIGVIVVNSTDDTITMGGDAHGLRIGAVMVGHASGDALKALSLPTGIMRLKAVQPLQIDATLDTDVVFHEYGHGLTWRMIGGMDGPLAGAIGEGASDTVAFLVNGDSIVGEYSSSNPAGIRRYDYASYPLTYADVTGAEVHNDGEIYAAAMWQLRTLWLKARYADTLLFDYFIDGMNYTPSTPAYEDMRNGMLQSIAASGTSAASNYCSLVWQAFAALGIGDGAKGTVVSSTSVAITESTKTRSNCTYQ